MKQLEPMSDRVIVRPKERSLKERAVRGIIIAGKEDQCLLGEVVAHGPGLLNRNGEHVPIGVTVGEFVLFQKHSGVEVAFEDEQLIALRSDSLVARITGQDADDMDF